MPGTILVVDDNPDTADAIALQLRESGHEVAKAYSAREALDLLDENSAFHLVISDVRMPGVSGFDFRRVVRHRFPGLPMVLITGTTITSDDVVPRDAIVLQKPVVIATLEHAIAEALQSSVSRNSREATSDSFDSI
jgi:CheY-like chemotaxis protein